MNTTRAPSPSIWFYRDAQGVELNLLRLYKGRIDLIESKWAEIPNERAIHTFTAVKDLIKKSKTYSVGDSNVVCRSEATYKINDIQVIDPNSLPC